MRMSRQEAMARGPALRDEAARRLREDLEPDERIVAESGGVLVTSRRIRSVSRPGDVGLDRVTSWHVAWSHDGRPTIVVEHEPVTGPVRRPSRTILWFHLGGDLRDVERTETAVPFGGRRRAPYRAAISTLEATGHPRTDDVHESLLGTRDERLGASVSMPLFLRVSRPRRRQPPGLVSVGPSWGRRRPSASDP
jgi:hypothetical protein